MISQNYEESEDKFNLDLLCTNCMFHILGEKG